MQELLEALQPQAIALIQQTWQRFSQIIQLQRDPQCPPQKMLRVGMKLLEAEVLKELQRNLDKNNNGATKNNETKKPETLMNNGSRTHIIPFSVNNGGERWYDIL
jgi:hypothetical protein